MELLDFILHFDKHLQDFINNYGTLVYGLLFLIVFMETGLVVTPFLPGDSLLFAAGALAANEMNHLMSTTLEDDPVVATTTSSYSSPSSTSISGCVAKGSPTNSPGLPA